MKLNSEQMAVLEENLRLRGQDMRIHMTVEEMAELTKELMKYKRGKDNLEDIIEEMADCFIVLEGLKPTFGIKDSDVQKIVDAKMERLTHRNQKIKENNAVK